MPWTFADGDVQTPIPRATATSTAPVSCGWSTATGWATRCATPTLPAPGYRGGRYAIAGVGPGAVIIPDTGAAADDYSSLQPGDLVFFDLDGQPQIDHVAFYLGLDSSGHHRFLSSRAKADGPTLGDLGGTSLLDDGGLYSRGFRTARRV